MSTDERPARVVLVIDDEKPIREMLAMALSLYGMRVVEAADGPSGLSAARSFRPDVVLIDIMMPHVDGLEVVRRMREDPELRSMPVIFVTARGSLEHQWEGWTSGVDSYVTKPVDPDLLVAEIDRVTTASTS